MMTQPQLARLHRPTPGDQGEATDQDPPTAEGKAGGADNPLVDLLAQLVVNSQEQLVIMRRLGQLAPAPAAESDDEDMIDLKTLCEMANISEAQGERLKGRGKLPPHVVLGSRCHRWRRGDVRRWIERQLAETRQRQERQAQGRRKG
jgi:predicted DNA-binding transcriptional regulator AlpA